TCGGVGGLGVVELLAGGSEALLESGDFGVGFGFFGPRLLRGFRRLRPLGAFLRLLRGRFVAKGSNAGGRLQRRAEIGTVLLGDGGGFGEELLEARFHRLFGLGSETIALLLPALVFGNDVGHKDGFNMPYLRSSA